MYLVIVDLLSSQGHLTNLEIDNTSNCDKPLFMALQVTNPTLAWVPSQNGLSCAAAQPGVCPFSLLPAQCRKVFRGSLELPGTHLAAFDAGLKAHSQK
jgi:hypothetical protein